MNINVATWGRWLKRNPKFPKTLDSGNTSGSSAPGGGPGSTGGRDNNSATATAQQLQQQQQQQGSRINEGGSATGKSNNEKLKTVENVNCDAIRELRKGQIDDLPARKYAYYSVLSRKRSVY